MSHIITSGTTNHRTGPTYLMGYPMRLMAIVCITMMYCILVDHCTTLNNISLQVSQTMLWIPISRLVLSPSFCVDAPREAYIGPD
jgi:hypothetical protein